MSDTGEVVGNNNRRAGTEKRTGARVLVYAAHRISHHRGTAEIELILSVVLLITILMLSLGAMRIAVERLNTSNAATFEAFSNATTGQTPQYTDDTDLVPIDGIGSIRPGLPNRTHVPRPTTQVSVYAGNKETLPAATIGAKAGLASPAWTYSAYPVGGADAQATQQWFLDDAAESHTYLSDPLRLAPAWTP